MVVEQENNSGNDVIATGSTWTVDAQHAAFNFLLTGELVPEPATILLLGCGGIGLLAVLGVFRRRIRLTD
jgi:hypothetical protein